MNTDTLKSIEHISREFIKNYNIFDKERRKVNVSYYKYTNKHTHLYINFLTDNVNFFNTIVNSTNEFNFSFKIFLIDTCKLNQYTCSLIFDEVINYLFPINFIICDINKYINFINIKNVIDNIINTINNSNIKNEENKIINNEQFLFSEITKIDFEKIKPRKYNIINLDINNNLNIESLFTQFINNNDFMKKIIIEIYYGHLNRRYRDFIKFLEHNIIENFQNLILSLKKDKTNIINKSNNIFLNKSISYRKFVININFLITAT
jgi:hypothetical protein